MRASRTYGSGRGACDETHVPTATPAPQVHHAARRGGGVRRPLHWLSRPWLESDERASGKHRVQVEGLAGKQIEIARDVMPSATRMAD
jgi:hypothetical protein